jgi:hypothetical protein
MLFMTMQLSITQSMEKYLLVSAALDTVKVKAGTLC